MVPETFLPGYPARVWSLRPGEDDAIAADLHRRLLEASIDLTTDDLPPLRRAAAAHEVVVGCGVHER